MLKIVPSTLAPRQRPIDPTPDLLRDACHAALRNLNEPNADPRTIAETLRQTSELVLAELTERDHPLPIR